MERRRPPLSVDLLQRVGLVWLLVSAFLIAMRWPDIAAMRLTDSDDILRLVQLRDLLAGQSWFDLHQYRISPPDGVLMHWSRLVDLPLLLVYAVLAPLLGGHAAEQATVVIVPLLTLGAALLLVGRLAWRMVGEDAVFYACGALVLALGALVQLQPLRIDHHGWQIVCLLAALNGLAARDARSGGRVAGVAMGLGMTISLELLPLAALIGAVAALRWLRDPKAPGLCLSYVRALAVSATIAFLATRGLADLAGHCDTLSVPYLAGLVVIATGLSLLALAGNLPAPARALGLAGAAAAGLGVVLAIAPQCSRGPFVMLDPLVQQYWYANVGEGMPAWRQDGRTLLRLLVPSLAGLWAVWRLWRGSAGWLQRFWGEYLLLVLGGIALALLVSRSAAFAAALVAVPLSWLLYNWRRRALNARKRGEKAALATMALVILLPDAPLGVARIASPARASSGPAVQEVCDVPAAATALRRLPASTIFAPIDSGPLLLVHTPHSVVATAHHRAAQGLHDTIAAFLAAPDQAEAIVRKRGARYVLICPGLVEAGIYRRAAPGGFMARLVAGQAPSWLRPMPLPRESGALLWEVLPPGQPAGAGPVRP